ncbi:MAG: hypothetical protein ACOCV8_01140 [Spirochaetota bacterium]
MVKSKNNKKLIIILIIISITGLFVNNCLHREYTIDTDPQLPEGEYFIRYFEYCGMRANCTNQIDENKALKSNEYFKTFETSDIKIVLAYHYKMEELYRKIFYHYNEKEKLIKSEYTDPANNILSYNIFKYNKNRKLVEVLEYLKDDNKDDKLYRQTKYIYNESDKIKIIDIKEYTQKDFVRRKYIIILYDIEGEITSQTEYDTYYLVFKPSIGSITKDMLQSYFLQNPSINDYELIEDSDKYTGYTILHIKYNTKEIAKHLLLALKFVGEIRETKRLEFSDNIITFIRDN